jgi:hypothetical protein
MPDRREAIDLITLPDEKYLELEDDALTQLSLAFSQWSSGGDSGPPEAVDLEPLLVVSSPNRLLPEDGNRWPLLVGRRINGLRAWQADWDQNAHIIRVDLQSGEVLTQRLVVSLKRKKPPKSSGQPPRPSDFDAATVRAGVQRYEPFSTHRTTPDEGRFALSVIYLDWLSNTVVTEIGEPPGFSPSQTNATPTVGVEWRTNSPDSVEVSPLSFSLAEKGDPKNGLIMNFAINASISDLAARSVTSPDESYDTLLPVTVLLFRRDDASPARISLLAPTNTGGQPSVNASFAVDLLTLPGAESLGGAYQAYVVAGKFIQGPRAVRISSQG